MHPSTIMENHVLEVVPSEKTNVTSKPSPMDIVYDPFLAGSFLLVFIALFFIVKRLLVVHRELILLPRIRKDMTVLELRQYDGTQDEGRVLVAVNGWIFDVTPSNRFYGPGGPYAAFGGRDASRGLATFSVTCSDQEYDDLSDLNSMQMDSVKEWEAQFREKYDLVGRLLRPGEEPHTYSEDEVEETDASAGAESYSAAVVDAQRKNK